jgi:CRP-like cAMP-binding protein
MFATERKAYIWRDVCSTYSNRSKKANEEVNQLVDRPRFKNTLLNALEADTLARLRLSPAVFRLKHELERPHTPLKHLYFLETGMASMTTWFKDGSQVEVGTFGHESIIGISALMGVRRSLNQVYTQIPGYGFSCSIEHALAEFRRNGGFQYCALRYVQAQLDQATRSIGCNAKHKFEPRLARWLLTCRDRADSDTFAMSHELLSIMLGGTRSTATIAAGQLKSKGLIEYRRGVIHILDTGGLERAACECYAIIKNHLKHYVEFDTALAE